MFTYKVPKLWGREVVLVTEPYCVKILQYDGVRTSSQHYHNEKHETFVVLRGLFEIERFSYDDPSDVVTGKYGPGACLVLPPRTVHKVTCIHPEGGWIIEASSKEDPNDCVRLAPSVNPFGK